MAQLRMVWKGISPKDAPLKDGYTLFDRTTDRYTQEQLADGWNDACTELNNGVWMREKYFDFMGNDPLIPEDGIFFVASPEGRIISTATVQVRDDHTGNLHMVGSVSDVRGTGAGKAVCKAVVDYFIKHEIKVAYLNTDDFRKPAIKIYLDLGYRPYLYDTDMPERWHALMEYFGIDKLEAYDADLHEQVMYSVVRR